jgi:hypothetical protein
MQPALSPLTLLLAPVLAQARAVALSSARALQ